MLEQSHDVFHDMLRVLLLSRPERQHVVIVVIQAADKEPNGPDVGLHLLRQGLRCRAVRYHDRGKSRCVVGYGLFNDAEYRMANCEDSRMTEAATNLAHCAGKVVSVALMFCH